MKQTLPAQIFCNFQAGARLFVFLVVTLICMPFYRFSWTPGAQRRVSQIWFHSVHIIVGLDLRASGQAHRDGPVLYVANHVSYLDIIVLGLMLDGVFVAKHDVADWPLFGRLARMRQCIFVTRNPVNVQTEVEAIRARLTAGQNVILFPEGTTGSGGGLLPFKSALLAATQGVPNCRVQPVSIAYPDLERGGVDASLAWYGKTALFPHLWSVLGRGYAPAGMRFHPALSADDFADRKALAAACKAHISAGLSSLTGAAPAPVREADEPALFGMANM